ncbi:MAG: SpoIIE family protein phosphatase [Prevotella sp.]|nr:SpoIIE family protein phosphatase [Prevotella sp.]
MKQKKPKMRSFARRLTRRIALTQLVVMGLASYLIYQTARFFVNEEEIDMYQSYLWTANARVNGILTEVSASTENRVDEIENSLDRPDKMMAIMKEVVARSPHIRSCGISFAADYYPQKGHWFCPYAVRDDDGRIVQRFIGDKKNDYLKAEWFVEAMKAEKGYWSKPFFDSTDTITPLVAYLVPIHDVQGKTVAVLGADLLLSWFNKRLLEGIHYSGDSVHVEFRRGQAAAAGTTDDDDDDSDDRRWRFISMNFIIDTDGTFIAHPDGRHVISDNYFERAKETPDTIDDYVGRQMVAGRKGVYCDSTGSAAHFEFFDMDRFNVYMFYEPVEGTNWSMGLAVPRLMIDGPGMAIGIVMLVLIALGMLVTRIVGRIVVNRATRPLKLLAESADKVAEGNFNVPLPRIKHNDEIRMMRDSFEDMERSLTEYIDNLKDTTASKAAIENELKVAHDIQMSMLPKTFPPYPERDDIDIYGSVTPAKDVGGDLFDFFIRDERLFFCIGDVSGKGVPASLVMAVTRSLFRNISAHTAEPDHIVLTLNNALADGNEANMFVTLFVGVLDLQTGLLNYCNAGHDEPLLISCDDVSTLACDPNLPVGIMAGCTFTRQQVTIAPQTTLFLYTDGLNEAENVQYELFGMHRIVSLSRQLMAEGNNQPATVVSRMTEAVKTFVGEAEQSDDLTMLAIKYMKL